MTTNCKNIVGPLVRKRRYALGWTQKELATKLQILGWDLDRVGVSKVESQLVWISDFEMLFLAKALKTEVPRLYPIERTDRTFYENVMQWRGVK